MKAVTQLTGRGRRWFGMAVVVGLSATLLAACGGSSSDNKTAVPAASTTKAVVSTPAPAKSASPVGGKASPVASPVGAKASPVASPKASPRAEGTPKP